jgi:hypothetical protein
MKFVCCPTFTCANYLAGNRRASHETCGNINTSQPTGDILADAVNTERLSFLEWILSIISPSSQPAEGQEPDPEPVDPSTCEPCSE